MFMIGIDPHRGPTPQPRSTGMFAYMFVDVLVDISRGAVQRRLLKAGTHRTPGGGPNIPSPSVRCRRLAATLMAVGVTLNA